MLPGYPCNLLAAFPGLQGRGKAGSPVPFFLTFAGTDLICIRLKIAQSLVIWKNFGKLPKTFPLSFLSTENGPGTAMDWNLNNAAG
jgi:hypothetical protein